jgi:hypothetical protein
MSRRMRLVTILPLLLLVFFPTAALPAPVQDGEPVDHGINTFKFEGPSFAYNRCTREVILLDVTLRVISQERTGNGGNQFVVTTIITGQGIGATTGYKYTFHRMSHAIIKAETISETSPIIAIPTKIELVSQETGLNQNLKVISQVTITPGGEITAVSNEFDFDCGW